MIRLEVYTIPTGYNARVQLVTAEAGGSPVYDQLWECDHKHPDHIEAEACGAAEIKRRLEVTA